LLQLPRLLFAASCRSGSGTVVVDSPAARLELSRGFVYALSYSPPDLGLGGGRAEEALRLLLKRAQGGRFEENAPATGRSRCTPFHPASVVRNHLEAELPEGAGASFRMRAARGTLRLQLQPHASCLGSDEKRLVALLAVPRTLADLDAARVAIPPRTDKLLAFLAAIEALSLDGGGTSAWAALELPEWSSGDEVRKSYKRLARALHPDLHPESSESERREMESKLASITAAYRVLVP
jgi:hypothetical protein